MILKSLAEVSCSHYSFLFKVVDGSAVYTPTIQSILIESSKRYDDEDRSDWLATVRLILILLPWSRHRFSRTITSTIPGSTYTDRPVQQFNLVGAYTGDKTIDGGACQAQKPVLYCNVANNNLPSLFTIDTLGQVSIGGLYFCTQHLRGDLLLENNPTCLPITCFIDLNNYLVCQNNENPTYNTLGFYPPADYSTVVLFSYPLPSEFEPGALKATNVVNL